LKPVGHFGLLLEIFFFTFPLTQVMLLMAGLVAVRVGVGVGVGFAADIDVPERITRIVGLE
jgi:hypothetical protein